MIRPDGRRGHYHTVLAPAAVGVLPCFADGSILMVGQYRHCIARYSTQRLPFDTAYRMAVAGTITDSITIVALFRMKERAAFPWS